MTASQSPDNLNALFGDIDVTRTVHRYEDGVVVEILNLNNGEGTPTEQKYNGSRVFYKDDKVLCRFPGYSIEKYVVSADNIPTAIDQVLEPIVQGVPEEEIGALCLTNDGPLLLIFKIEGKVRIHMMRSAGHGFESQFNTDFSEQYGNASFGDLFSASLATSPWCHLFRQGSRSSAMTAPKGPEGRTLLYLGGVECNSLCSSESVGEEMELAVLQPQVAIISPQSAAAILSDRNLGMICYRHASGEVQLLSEN